MQQIFTVKMEKKDEFGLLSEIWGSAISFTYFEALLLKSSPLGGSYFFTYQGSIANIYYLTIVIINIFCFKMIGLK